MNVPRMESDEQFEQRMNDWGVDAEEREKARRSRQSRRWEYERHVRQTAALPPYTPGVRCPKCSYDAVTTTHRAEQEGSFSFYADQHVEGHCEALVRSCSRCGFSWDERPADVEVSA